MVSRKKLPRQLKPFRIVDDFGKSFQNTLNALVKLQSEPRRSFEKRLQKKKTSVKVYW
jgi:predicted 3-demethylubiquinone-9 3-methyltransferase (glyoxalase superfamily)